MNDTALQQKRLVAAAIDIGIGLGLAIVLGIVSAIVGVAVGFTVGTTSTIGNFVMELWHFAAAAVCLAYVLGRDVLGEGRSLGKKTQDLKVLNGSGGVLTLEDSVRRNAIFALGSTLVALSTLLDLIPFVGGVLACLLTPLLVLGSLATFAAAIVEMVKIIQDPAGIRFGDQFARTRVVRS